MLSPTMITSGNACRWYATNICRPVSYCAVSPVPLSPMTPKVSDPGAAPSGTAAGAAAPAGDAGLVGGATPDGADTQATAAIRHAAVTCDATRVSRRRPGGQR